MENQKVSFEQALEQVGTELEKQFFANPEAMALCDKDDIAYKKIKVMTRHKNTDPATGKLWKADYHTRNKKWFPWAYVEASEETPSGFGLSRTHANYDYAGTAVGVRLCTETERKAREVFEENKELYIDFWL